MLRIERAVRFILLGPDGSYVARFACGKRAILSLAILGLALHMLDLVTGIRMMALYGLSTEQNPVARGLFQFAGPLGLSIAKLGVVSAGIAALVYIAARGRPRLARNALILAALLGMLGFTSNLI